MEIILAKSAGFCFGVKRAVDYAYSKAGTGKIYTYGPIIHNKEVTGDLDKKGVHVTENLDDIKDGEVIIRSHGVPPDVYKALEDRGIRYTDCTCPFVKKIHNIVHDNHNKGKSIIIVGNKDHPEIIGINGWCDNSALIINSVEEAQETVLSDDREYALVVQTTFQTDVFDEIIDILKEKREDIDVFRTICSATGDRQTEAVEIAKSVDVMIVLGDKSSSNTRKLYDICKKYCKNVYLCERICDLQLQNVKKDVKIGITAGASTPSMIIKEAVKTMNDAESKTFEEMIDDSMVTLKTGQIVKGKVISISDSGEVAVDLGYKSDGIITRSEFSNDENDDPAETLKPGDEIDVYVIRVNDGDGNVQLSKRRAEMDKTYDAIEEAHNNGATIKAKITSQIKGGLIAYSNGARVFIPSSQISNRYVEDLSVYVGQELDFEILEFDKSKRRVVVGRKALVQREIDAKRAELFASIKVGDRLNGKVSRIVDFGAFVDLGGVDGLIHISELSWGRVKKVTDVLSVGDDVVVTVLDVKPEKGKISLSLKDLDADPWKTAAEKYPVGSIVTGKVVRMVSFGAFVELEEGVDGLVHISQIAYKHVENPSDELEVGQEVQAKVTEINVENKKLSLSIKETLERPARPIKEPRILEPTPAQEEKAEEKPEEAAAAAEEPEKEIPVTEAAADEAPAEETVAAEAEEVSVSEEAAAAEESEETPAAEAEEAPEEEAEETPEEEAEETPAEEEAPAEEESAEAPAEEETSEDEE